MISNRHSEANNMNRGDDFDESKPSTYITYLDCNYIYGAAMSQYLPISGFRWIEESEFCDVHVDRMADDAPDGYILEVDLEVNLEYPPEQHDLNNDLPVAPEIMIITNEMLSPYSKQIRADLNCPKATSVQKLEANLNDKIHYVVPYRNLYQYLTFGLKLKKIHNILKFKQRPWLLPYIEFNTKQQIAKNNFEKDYFKLMINSFFGKTMENLKNMINIELVNNI